ncbi:MAG: hypothetical protein P0S93_06410 [Candidatus Neptunochlamydia sp.]|nr:hypothetical protein [Candidatus Neptunochlamydia sp.]
MKLPFSFKPNFDAKLSLQKKSVVIGCYSLFIFPFLLLMIHLNYQLDHLKELEGMVDRLAIQMECFSQSQKDRYALMSRYEDVDHYYIDHVLESMTLLKPEVEALKLIYSHPAFQTCANVKNRLERLTRGGNLITFAEGNREVKNGIEEVELSQSRPVEINTNDLKMILAAVEGVTIGKEFPSKGRPHLIVKGFHLNKKKLAERETYLLEMQLIKRGYLK